MPHEQFAPPPDNVPEHILSETEKSSDHLQGEIDDSSLTLKRPGRAKRTLGLGLGLGLTALGGVEAAAHLETKSAQAAEANQAELAVNPNAKYAELIKDNLPNHLESEDIDPRYQQVAIFKHRIVSQGKDWDARDVIRKEARQLQYELDTSTGWADPARQKLLNTLLNESDIKRQLTETQGLTLADAISLLKATIINAGKKGAFSETLKMLIKERDTFAKREIVGPHTDEFIGFNYAAKDADQFFSGKNLRKIAETAIGKKAAEHPEMVKIISTGEPSEEDPTQENAGDRLLKTIEQSRGNTVLYLNTHSSDSQLAVNLSDPDHQQFLSPDSIALSLLNRLLATKDSQDLGKITIFGDGCKEYDFRIPLMESLQRNYHDGGYEQEIGKPFSELGLPTIITMAGEKSLTMIVPEFPGGARALSNADYLKKIEQAGGITGKILFDLQASSYVTSGDMAFFVPKQGKLTEISSLESTTKNFKYGDQDLQITV